MGLAGTQHRNEDVGLPADLYIRDSEAIGFVRNFHPRPPASAAGQLVMRHAQYLRGREAA